MRCFTNKLSFYKHKAYKHVEAEIHFKHMPRPRNTHKMDIDIAGLLTQI